MSVFFSRLPLFVTSSLTLFFFSFCSMGRLCADSRQSAQSVDLDQQNNDHSTQLGIAALAGKNEIVRSLLARGAYVDAPTRTSYMTMGTALGAAALSGHTTTVRLLLEAGANPMGVPASVAGAPLWSAVMSKKQEIVGLLLDTGLNPDHPLPPVNHSVLFVAIEAGDASMVQFLIKRGASVNEIKLDGTTPLKFAIDRKLSVIAQMLKKSGAKISLTPAEQEQTVLRTNFAECREAKPEPAERLAGDISTFFNDACSAPGSFACAIPITSGFQGSCGNLSPGLRKFLAKKYPAAAGERFHGDVCSGKWQFQLGLPCQKGYHLTTYVLKCQTARDQRKKTTCSPGNVPPQQRRFSAKDMPSIYRTSRPVPKKTWPRTESRVVTKQETYGSSTSDEIHLRQFSVEECNFFLDKKAAIESNDLFSMCITEVAEEKGNPELCMALIGKRDERYAEACARSIASASGDARGCVGLSQTKRYPGELLSPAHNCLDAALRKFPSAAGNELKELLHGK